MIPDSGTTIMMGPQEQVYELEAGVCDRWDRCKALQNEVEAEYPGTPLSHVEKSILFENLLYYCNSWLTEEEGLYEIPSLFFHVKGRDHSSDTVELTAWAWITETSYLMDATTERVKICTSGIGSMGSDYITELNGPIWILGTPLFYEYTVGYDYSSLSVSLERGTCSSCDSEGASMLSDSGEARRKRGRPRFTDSTKPLRVKKYDITIPL
jgi:hypothetical protein